MRDNSFVTVILILALLYIISPIDLIPDVIPVVGWADDLSDIPTYAECQSAGTLFLYSTRYLEPDHAAMLAEWLDVGQAASP